MPTETEFEKMIAATYWEWNDTDKGYYVYAPTSGDEGGLNGKKSDKSTSISGSYTKTDALLFFPAVGIGTSGNYGGVGSAASYWSSTLSTTTNLIAFRLFIKPGDCQVTDYQGTRSNGHSIRPVSE